MRSGVMLGTNRTGASTARRLSSALGVMFAPAYAVPIGTEGGTVSMNAIRYHQYGGPEQLRYEDAPTPKPAQGHALVRVQAASVNPFDFKLASGAFKQSMPLTFPFTPGGDFAGVVESVGSGVTTFKRGDAVFGNSPSGGAYAQFVSVPASLLAAKPKKLTPIEAASVPIAAQTAWQALFDEGRLDRGQTVLIHGASAGVGTFAVQLAHWKGARVLATGSADNMDYLRSLGSDQAIDYRATPFETVAKNVDVILDLVGGETQKRSYKAIKPGGRLMSTVQPPSQDDAVRQNVKASFVSMQPSAERLRQLADLLSTGAIRTIVSARVPLAQAAEAWRQQMSGHTRGKIVLEVAA
jgi:NADPH:quinone reductase-like Zn-dependent oxidoreductase